MTREDVLRFNNHEVRDQFLLAAKAMNLGRETEDIEESCKYLDAVLDFKISIAPTEDEVLIGTPLEEVAEKFSRHCKAVTLYCIKKYMGQEALEKLAAAMSISGAAILHFPGFDFSDLDLDPNISKDIISHIPLPKWLQE